MKRTDVTPWRDHAVLIRSGNIQLCREIVAEGPLSEIVSRIARTGLIERGRLTIRFPDRHVEPFSFEEPQFISLIVERLAQT